MRFAFVLAFAASFALAQDKARVPIAESKVDVAVVHISKSVDGGCFAQADLTAASAAALAADGVPFVPVNRKVADAICAAVIPAGLKAAKLDLGVGSGAKP